MSARLGVNVDHVATLRQARRATYPDPVTAAALAELAGADQITIHLREDRRHIQDRDLLVLRKTVSHPAQPGDGGGAGDGEDRLRGEARHRDAGAGAARGADHRGRPRRGGGARPRAPRRSRRCATPTSRSRSSSTPSSTRSRRPTGPRPTTVEFHTGRYCDARLASDRRRELARLVDACKAAAKLGLQVAAGHGLNYQNVLPVAAIPEIEELNIGHAIVARAVLVGLERAVREMKELLRQARP